MPIDFGGTKHYFFYDSGASLFPVKTSNHLISKLPPIIYTDTLENITTWGKSYDVPGGEIKSDIKIGHEVFSNPLIYVHPDPESYHTEIFEEAETLGLIGNYLFDNRIIIIDFTRMKFVII